MASEISFDGFGPITQSKPTFHGGFGREGSFVPLSKNQVSFEQGGKQKPNSGFPFLGYSVNPDTTSGHPIWDVFIGQNQDGPQWIPEVSSVAIQNELIATDGTSTTAAEFDVDVSGKDTDGIVSLYTAQDDKAQEISLEVKESTGTAEIYAGAGDAAQNVYIRSDDTAGESYLKLNNAASANQILILQKANDTKIYMTQGSNYVLIDIPDNAGTLLNAYWQEINICVDGLPKKMKVLGTEPY